MGSGLWQELARLTLSFLLIANIFAALVGVLMVIAPQRLAKWSRLPNKWISTQALIEPLEQMHDVDSRALRHPRLLGLLLLTSAAFILVQGGLFVWRLGIIDGGRLLADLFAGQAALPALWETLWVSLITLLMLGALLALAIGLLALFGAQWLHGVLTWANRWVSTRKGTDVFDVPHYALDGFVRRRPRLWGAAIALLASYTVVALLWVSRVS